MDLAEVMRLLFFHKDAMPRQAKVDICIQVNGRRVPLKSVSSMQIYKDGQESFSIVLHRKWRKPMLDDVGFIDPYNVVGRIIGRTLEPGFYFVQVFGTLGINKFKVVSIGEISTWSLFNDEQSFQEAQRRIVKVR